MPSVKHEVVVQTLHDPAVLAELLQIACGMKVDTFAVSDPNLRKTKTTKTTEWRGDAFFLSGGRKEPSSG